MTTLGTTSCQNSTTATGTGANKETMGALAANNGRLVSTFHGETPGERESARLDIF